MAKHFQVPALEEAPAKMFLQHFERKEDLHDFMVQRKQWMPIHDKVMEEFKTPLIALAWRAYRPGLTAEKDVALPIYGITILTPIEADEMILDHKKRSILNQPRITN